MRLSKEKRCQQLKEIHQLWCSWDPIGVTIDPDWPQDEYDGYLEPTLHLLESGASEKQLTDYLASVVGEHMGLGLQGIEHSKPAIFSKKLCTWYNNH